MPKAKAWSVSDIQRLMATSTGCICLLILLICIFVGVMTGKISPAMLGDIKGYAVGTGLLGFGLILFLVIRISLPGNASAAPDSQPANGKE